MSETIEGSVKLVTYKALSPKSRMSKTSEFGAEKMSWTLTLENVRQ
jgi:hypothetical protein